MSVKIIETKEFERTHKKPPFIEHMQTSLENRKDVIRFLKGHIDWNMILLSTDGTYVIEFDELVKDNEMLDHAWKIASKYHRRGIKEPIDYVKVELMLMVYKYA
jgi:hypothetical protein